MQIHWDRNSAALGNAAYGVLEISEDGAVPKAIQLDAASLQTGSFTYQRTAAKVDLKLVIHRKSGAELRESTSFLGEPPDRKAKEEAAALKEREAEAVRQRDELAKQTTKMKADLNWQAAKTKKLEKEMQAIREEMRLQQQRRLANQAPRQVRLLLPGTAGDRAFPAQSTGCRVHRSLTVAAPIGSHEWSPQSGAPRSTRVRGPA